MKREEQQCNRIGSFIGLHRTGPPADDGDVGRQPVLAETPGVEQVAMHTWWMQRNPDDLRAFSEHLLYEAELLFRLADRLRATSDGQGELPWEIEMACIESFAVHARALVEFLWGDPKGDRFPDDAFASDYFPPSQWADLRERVQRSAIDGLGRRTGNEIAHLSYRRSALPTEARAWDFDVIAGVVGRAFRLFLENVPPDLVAEDFESRLRSTWPEYLNFPVAISFPPDRPARSVATRMMTGSPPRPARFEELLPVSIPATGVDLGSVVDD